MTANSEHRLTVRNEWSARYRLASSAVWRRLPIGRAEWRWISERSRSRRRPGPSDADITDPDTYVAGVPHATFLRLRTRRPGAAGGTSADGPGFWAVTRYDDLLTVSRNVEMFSSAQGIRLEEMDPEETEARRTMMELDPPEHTAYRRLVSKPFSRAGCLRLRGGDPRAGARVLDEALVEETARLRRSHRQAAPDAHAGCAARRARGATGRGWSSSAMRCSATPIPSSPTHPVDLVDTEEFRLMPFRSPAGHRALQVCADQADSTARPSPPTT